MKALLGNTFPIRDVIKQKGGRWDASAKLWRVPPEVHDELKKLLPKREINFSNVGKHECEECGDDVYSGSTCWETGLKH